MSYNKKAGWRKEYKFTPENASEKVYYNKPEEESCNSELINVLVSEKNKCARHNFETIELTYGKNTDEWIDVRKIILRSINDYHRFILEVLDYSTKIQDEQ